MSIHGNMIVDGLTSHISTWENPTEDRKESLKAASTVHRPSLVQALQKLLPED
jgi:hypothetical protein